MNLLYALMALAGGVALSTQAAVNSRLSAGLGRQPLVASFVSFAVGTLCLGLAAAWRGNWPLALAGAGQIPAWRGIGGALGAAVVFTTVFLAPRIGVANAMFLFIVGQLATGVAIDGAGLLGMPARPLHWWKFTGLAVMFAGLALFVFGDRLFGAGGASAPR